MNVGEIIRQCRWANEWSVRKLSEESGIARQTICDAEYSRRNTSVAVLVELLDSMGYELVVSKKQVGKYRVAEATITRNE